MFMVLNLVFLFPGTSAVLEKGGEKKHPSREKHRKPSQCVRLTGVFWEQEIFSEGRGKERRTLFPEKDLQEGLSI